MGETEIDVRDGYICANDADDMRFDVLTGVYAGIFSWRWCLADKRVFRFNHSLDR